MTTVFGAAFPQADAKTTDVSGLNYLEFVSALALQGMLAGGSHNDPDNLAEQAERYADALIKRISKRAGK